jgi:tryptophanyl-tRNA synthetase
MTKPVILTGIRANNDLTIGNYLGALLPLIDMAKSRAGEYQVNLFVPDLHSFTTPIDHSQLYGQILQNLRVFVAAGLPLDNPDVHIYRQSYVPAHSELTWILDCFTGFGEMNRMTQFKDKSGKLHEDRISVGLFNYPVLMAADVLLYGAQYVPVGDDQTQHLEFTRDIAERMNNQFGDLFTVPYAVPKQHEFFGKDQGLRIKDLLDPTKKMSKSDETGKGVIFLSDTPEAAAKKIMGATTDSFGEIQYHAKERPGISNLIQILALLNNRELKDVISEYSGQTSYGDLKKVVAEAVSNFLKDFHEKLAKVDDAKITAKLESSEAAMREQAGAVLLKAQRAVGLRSEKPARISPSGSESPSSGQNQSSPRQRTPGTLPPAETNFDSKLDNSALEGKSWTASS